MHHWFDDCDVFPAEASHRAAGDQLALGTVAVGRSICHEDFVHNAVAFDVALVQAFSGDLLFNMYGVNVCQIEPGCAHLQPDACISSICVLYRARLQFEVLQYIGPRLHYVRFVLKGICIMQSYLICWSVAVGSFCMFRIACACACGLVTRHRMYSGLQIQYMVSLSHAFLYMFTWPCALTLFAYGYPRTVVGYSMLCDVTFSQATCVFVWPCSASDY